MSTRCQRCGEDVVDRLLCQRCYAEWREERRKETAMDDLKRSKLTGLWLKTSKQGKKYMKGSFSIEALQGLLADISGTHAEVLLFINRKREGKEDTDPDYTMHVVPRTAKPAGGYTPDPEEPF